MTNGARGNVITNEHILLFILFANVHFHVGLCGEYLFVICFGKEKYLNEFLSLNLAKLVSPSCTKLKSQIWETYKTR